MSIEKAYDSWAEQYDTNINPTRDLEAIAFREILDHLSFDKVLEIGCGTGKNSQWFVQRAKHLVAADFSEEMLKNARSRLVAENVEFIKTDITKEWPFSKDFDLVSFSLVLEHIKNLDHVFSSAAKVLKEGGHLYLGELHPVKQYSGSKARFETSKGTTIVDCFDHHLSDYFESAKNAGLTLMDIREYFDNENKEGLPRILCLLFRK